MNYSKEAPFLAHICDRYRISHLQSTKETWHLSIGIDGSEMHYNPGDSLGILPKNPKSLVIRMISYLGRSADEQITDPRTGVIYRLHDWFLERVDLSSISERFLEGALDFACSSLERDRITSMIDRHNSSLVEPQTQREHGWHKSFDVPSLFEQFLPSGIDFVQLVPFFTPLLPRFYSIASSPLVSKEKIDLLITHVSYRTNQGVERVGLASHYLIKATPLYSKEVRVFLQRAVHFTLPDEVLFDQKPLLMIGPGTGVAPFRSFLQHIQTSALQKSPKLWLIFGERNREYDFLYKEYWDELTEKKILQFDAVFSRDGDEKEYVQHRMWAKRAEIYDWIYRCNGYFYICGDAKQMAKDVEAMLMQIIQHEGHLTSEELLAWMKAFRKSGRYRKDVY